MSVTISVVVPIYNEQECIVALWRRLRPAMDALGTAWEAILVDDGSSDDTPELLRSIATWSREVRVLHLPENRGQTAALAAGFAAARGEWIVTLDADLQNPPEEIPGLLAAADGVDLVYGRRVQRQDSLAKRVGSRVGNGFRNLVTGHHVHDSGCSLKLYRRSALVQVPLFAGMHRFLPTLFAFHGFRIREVEVRHEPRVGGVSKYTNLSRLRQGIADCFAVRWMKKRCLEDRAEPLASGSGRQRRPSGTLKQTVRRLGRFRWGQATAYKERPDT